MREIKFRAWDKERERMWYSNTPFSLDNTSWFFTAEKRRMESANYLPTNTLLMQFIGLQDKNGKKIYEGDLVKFEDRISEVYFEFGCFRTNDEIYKFDTLWNENCEVIGNVYQNKELLRV